MTESNHGGSGTVAGAGGEDGSGIRPASTSDPHLEPSARHQHRMELIVAASFAAAFVGTVGLAVVYWYGGQDQWEGAFLGLVMGGLGVGLTAWGKYLLPQGPFVQERETLSSPSAERVAYAASFGRGVGEMRRRSFLGKLLGGVVGAFGVVALFPFIRSLGPQPKKALFKTSWRKGSAVVQADGTPVHYDDLEVGGYMTVFPAHDANSAVSQTLLIRPSTAPFTTKPGRETWTPKGYVAFSKVCTHAGCPVSLYEEQTQQLLCPCHQSLFNILDGAMPIFGPAPRPLPQLPLYIDKKGYLRAQAGYDEPIGPGFWERGA